VHTLIEFGCDVHVKALSHPAPICRPEIPPGACRRRALAAILALASRDTSRHHHTRRAPAHLQEIALSAAGSQTSRRSAFRSLLAAAGATAAGLLGGKAHAATADANGIITGPDQAQQAEPKQPPLFSGHKVHNGLVYIAGKGYHEAGDIKVHTKAVLDSLEAELKKAGSSMEKVLKVNVYLHDLEDYAGMNEMYRGRFGANPPVRTTIAAYGGIPGKSLVEIDCIAAL
jgi:2-iminobutanoate/2-iminopropanoate deaminase